LRFFPFIVLTLFGALTSVSGAETSNTVPAYSKSFDPKRDPFVDGENALQYARHSKRRVLIELGGDWCTYCLQLDSFIATSRIVKDMLHKNFVVLKINVSDENDNKEFRKGLPRTFGFPHIFIADSDGSILYSKDTTQLREEGQYSQARFVEFLQEWRTPTEQ
jgi:thioredoxin-related protein